MGKDYKSSSEFTHVPEKEGNSTRPSGFLRFWLLVGLVVGLAFVVMAWSGRSVVTQTTPSAAEVVTTATPAAAGVAVNVQQSAPAVNVSIEQPPAPAPPTQPTTDYTSQLAFIEAQRAFTRGDEAYRSAERAYAHADVLHYRVAALETTVAMPRPDLAPTLVAFEAVTDQQRRELDALTAGVMVALLVVMVVAGVVGYMTIYHPPTPAPPQPLLMQNPPITLHGADTVLHRADTVQGTTSGDANALQLVNISARRDQIPRRTDELTPGQRRYIQATYNRLGTYSGTSKHLWGYHNASTLALVKSVVG